MLEIEWILHIPLLISHGCHQIMLVHCDVWAVQANAHRVCPPVKAAKVVEEPCKQLTKCRRVLGTGQRCQLLHEASVPKVLAAPLVVGNSHGLVAEELQVWHHRWFHGLQIMNHKQHVRVAVQATVRCAHQLVSLRPILDQSTQLKNPFIVLAVLAQQQGIPHTKLVVDAEIDLHVGSAVRKLHQRNVGLKDLGDIFEAVLWHN
mmetsp:Transcript_50779/g.135442  ORF Transcript_50779/g.135442 Transcript_50779/m.135442 type:complete len:204 (+) Transcript_50779:442-1053(+)